MAVKYCYCKLVQFEQLSSTYQAHVSPFCTKQKPTIYKDAYQDPNRIASVSSVDNKLEAWAVSNTWNILELMKGKELLQEGIQRKVQAIGSLASFKEGCLQKEKAHSKDQLNVQDTFSSSYNQNHFLADTASWTSIN